MIRGGARRDFAHHLLKAPQTHCNIKEIAFVAIPHLAQPAGGGGQQIEADRLDTDAVGDEDIDLLDQAGGLHPEREQRKARGFGRIDPARTLCLVGAVTAGMGHQKAGDNLALDDHVDRVGLVHAGHRIAPLDPLERSGNRPPQCRRPRTKHP